MRQPYTVLVFLFRATAGPPEYAVFQRADDSHWQSVSGGVEEGEDLEAAARREAAEETGLPATGPLFELDMVSGVEKTCFAAGEFWPESVYIVPKHFFAMDVTQERTEIVLSREHRDVRWLRYEAAYEASSGRATAGWRGGHGPPRHIGAVFRVLRGHPALQETVGQV